MTTHAYIADLPRARREYEPPHNGAMLTTQTAFIVACGEWIRSHSVSEQAGAVRCFGLRRLAEVWERTGHNVDCSVCRAEVERILAGRTDPAHEDRIAALTAWVEANPLRGADDTLKAEAQRRRMETQRRMERAARAAASPERVQGVCEFCGGDARAAWDYTCNALPCRVRRAKVTRLKRQAKARRVVA